MPKVIFDRLNKKRQRVPADVLEVLEERTASASASRVASRFQKKALRAGWAPVRRWMLANWEDYTDSRGEPNMTALAENAAWEARRDEWLDDPDHWVWAAAMEIHDMWEKGKL